MRKISEQVAEAFKNGECRKFGNTTIEYDPMGCLVVKLFGNPIAKKTDFHTLYSTCGYRTNTTRDRLTALIGGSVSFAKGECRIKGVEVKNDHLWFEAPTGWEEVELKGY